jgi:hypothetical protein
VTVLVAVWLLRAASLLAMAATTYFVALTLLTGPVHGPVIEVMFIGAALAVPFFVGSVKLAKLHRP